MIIPLYNKGKYIGRAMDSVLTQTYHDYEIIVVDDGSSDDGPEIVKQYREPRLRIVQQANAGPGAARNRGLKESSSPYVAFLDADDEWLPSFLDDSMQILGNHPDCDLCVSAWYQDKVLGFPDLKNVCIVDCYRKLGFKCAHGPYRIRQDAPIKEIRELLNLFFSSSLVVKRAVACGYGGFYDKSQYTYGEDFYLWIKLGINHRFFRNTKPLAYYHNNDSDLAVGLYKSNPLEAFLIDPENVRQDCLENRDLLEKWLASYALQNAHDRIGVGKIEDAEFLLKNYPLMKLWRWEYTKLIVKIKFPRLIPMVRWVNKKLLMTSHRKV